MSDDQSKMSLVNDSNRIKNLSPVDQQQMSPPAPHIISSKTSPTSPAQIQPDEQIPMPPLGMHYVLVLEQQASSILSQPILQAQQQRIGVNQCYVCDAVAIERCFYGTNSINHCKNMMCLQHTESTVQGPPWGTDYYCQEHYQGYLVSQSQCCSIS